MRRSHPTATSDTKNLPIRTALELKRRRRNPFGFFASLTATREFSMLGTAGTELHQSEHFPMVSGAFFRQFDRCKEISEINHRPTVCWSHAMEIIHLDCFSQWYYISQLLSFIEGKIFFCERTIKRESIATTQVTNESLLESLPVLHRDTHAVHIIVVRMSIPRFDVLLKNGVIVDGTGLGWFSGFS